VAAEDAAHDLEDGFEIDGSVDDGEGAGAEGVGEFAGVFAAGAAALDDECRRARGETGEEFEETDAGLFGCGAGCGVVGLLIEGEGEVDDGDIDADLFDEVGGLAAGVDGPGVDAHGLEEAGEAVGPVLIAPVGV